MPIVSPIPANPLADGRQSERALVIRRGVQRMLLQMNAHVLPELALASGRRADLVALTRSGEIWIIEIKSSIEDFRVDHGIDIPFVTVRGRRGGSAMTSSALNALAQEQE